MRNFCTELKVFHGNLVDSSRKAPQKAKSELGSPQPRLRLFFPRAGSRILASSLCLFPHLLYSFLSPRRPTFFLRQHAQGHQGPNFKYSVTTYWEQRTRRTFQGRSGAGARIGHNQRPDPVLWACAIWRLSYLSRKTQSAFTQQVHQNFAEDFVIS